MKTLILLVCVLCASGSHSLARAADMTLDFTWLGTQLCSPLPKSPEFQVGNVPAGTTQLRFVLLSPSGRDLGGAALPLPANGTVPIGAVAFRSPCLGGMYTWAVEAVSADGKTLGNAKLTRPFY